MYLDGNLLFSNAQDLTSATAGGTLASTNSIDLSNDTNLGTVSGIKFFAIFDTLPVSATSGATLSVSLQVSTDDATWETLEEFPAIPLANITSRMPFAVRAKPAMAAPYRYMQLVYSPSAVLTAGTVTAGLNLDVPSPDAYARNYVA